MNTIRASLYSKNSSSFVKAKSGFLIAATSLLAACGGGAGTPEDGLEKSVNNVVAENTELANQVETLVEGAAIKGAIENGIVNAFLVVEQNGIASPNNTPLTESVRTDSNGNYSLLIDEDLSEAIVVVEITADELTTMKCDVTAGCGQNEEGQDIEFGDRFPLAENFSLKSIVTNVDGGDEVSVSVSPLTHMAVAKLDGMVTGYTEQNVEIVFSDIESVFGLESGALNLKPADITRIEAYSNLSSAELEMGVISASILSLVGDSSQDTIENVLDELETVFRNDGGIAAQSSDDNNISVEDVLQSANDIADDLVQVLSDSVHSDELDIVAASISSSYDEIKSEDVALPVISSHPQAVTIEEGQSLNLSVVATGESVKYQWRKNGELINGATENSLKIASSSLSDAGEYDVQVSNDAGLVTSLSALVTISEVVADDNDSDVDNGDSGSDNSDSDQSDGSGSVIDLVAIISSPSSVSVKEGDNATLSVAVSGDGAISYQWRKGGITLPGQTSNTLSLTNVSAADAGQYDVQVTNQAGTVSSSVAIVEVDVIELVTILAAPQSLTVEEGGSAQLSVSVSGEGSISYQWRKDGVAISGQNSSTLNIENANAVDAGQYDVQVTNEAGTVASSAAIVTVDVIELVQIISSPSSVAMTEGDTSQLSVVVNGEGAISYQWRKDGSPLNGETNSTLTLSAVLLGDAGTYDVVVTNEAGAVISGAAVITVESATFDVSLDWDAPLKRADGSDIELYEINGYKIIYGTSATDLTGQVSVDDGSQMSYVFEDLESGTYYFSIATIDSDGAESDYSDVIAITL